MKNLQKVLLVTFIGLLFYGIFWIGTTATTVTLPEVGEPTVLYSNQVNDDLKQTFDQAIRKADHSILMIIYSLVDRKIIQSLRQKADEGLEVTVICDPEASVGVQNKLGPKVHTYMRRGQGIMHQKILVTDQSRVWIGSANMTTQSFRVHGNLVVGFHSKELAEMMYEKGKSMIKTGLKKPITHRNFEINEQQVEMWFLPEEQNAILRIQKLIQSAQKTIQVAMFTWTRFDLAEDLIEAHKRGVIVEVALDRSSANGASQKVANLLTLEGIPVMLNSGDGLLHHKMMIVDDETLLVGSANWTKAAFEKNNDCFVVISPLNQAQKETLGKMWDTIVKESIK
jgi:cardiolipin synthase